MFRKVIIVLVTNDHNINYKPSMKNVQSFHVIRFLTKITFVPRGRYKSPPPPPPSLTKQFPLNIYSKIREQAIKIIYSKIREQAIKIKKNIINNYELQNYNSLFEKKS